MTTMLPAQSPLKTVYGVTHRGSQPDLPLDELAVLARYRHEDHLPISDGSDGRARHDDCAGAGRRKAERHVHSQPEPAVRVRTSTRGLAVLACESTRGSM